jgi:uncharacterized protein YcfL
MRRVIAATVLILLTVAGCSSADDPTTEATPAASSTPSEVEAPSETASPTDSPTESSSPDADAIEIEIEGDRIEPNGRRVEITAGEPITLDVDSDRAAELHVHSSPEQVLTVEQGESTMKLVIETPGVVDVEEHDSGIVVLQLEVR